MYYHKNTVEMYGSTILFLSGGFINAVLQNTWIDQLYVNRIEQLGLKCSFDHQLHKLGFSDFVLMKNNLTSSVILFGKESFIT